jgi:hypothetical protein
MDRSEAIRLSLVAFGTGLASLIPVIGLFPAVHALHCWWKVSRNYRDWNPAERHLNWGARLALIGIGSTILIVTIVSFQVVG